MALSRFRIVVVALVCAFGAACGQQPAPAANPAKKAVSKRDDPEWQSRPPIDRAAKKIAANKPGDGRDTLVKAAAPPPMSITAGRPVNGTMSRSDQQFEDGSFVDYYVYAGTRGEHLTITMRSRALDAYLLIGDVHEGVFDPEVEDDDSGGNTDARLDVTLGFTGPAIIAANALNVGETGPYVLEVTSDIAGSGRGSGGGGGGGGGGRSNIGDLQFNTPMNGRLEAGDRQMQRDKTFFDFWIFDGRAGQRVTITMRSDTLDSYLILQDGTPGNAEVIGEDDDSGGGTNARITVTLPDTGPYTVLANSVDPGSGAYTLLLETSGSGGRGGAASAPSNPGIAYADRYPGNGDPNEKYALVVGIEDYPGTDKDLRGPVADARLFRDLLVNTFGFKPANVVMLTNAEATREHILNAFIRHLGQAGPQGAAVFYYSGHGTQMPTNLALTAPIDPEPDGRDEALFVWGTDEKSSIILDDEIGYAMDQLKTDKVLLVHDSCNSGTSARGSTEGGQAKTVAFTTELSKSVHLPRNFMVGAKAVPAPSSGGPQNLVDVLETRRQNGLLAGSKDEELSWTATGWPDKGGVASVFTYYLVSALETADGSMTFGQLMSKVQSQTGDYTKKKYQAVQTPQLSGGLASRTIASVLR